MDDNQDNLRDGIPRRLTFKRIRPGEDKFKLIKCLNVPEMNALVGNIFDSASLIPFYKDTKIDVIVK